MIREWCEEHGEAKELTYGQHFGFDHGWWLDLAQWGLGVQTERQYGNQMWAHRWWLNVNIGPLSWTVTREWEE